MKHIVLFFIKAYQKLIRPLLGQNCRFYPSCSEYCKTAFERKNFFYALFLSCKRLLRCGPWSEGGIDELP